MLHGKGIAYRSIHWRRCVLSHLHKVQSFESKMGLFPKYQLDSVTSFANWFSKWRSWSTAKSTETQSAYYNQGLYAWNITLKYDNWMHLICAMQFRDIIYNYSSFLFFLKCWNKTTVQKSSANTLPSQRSWMVNCK